MKKFLMMILALTMILSAGEIDMERRVATAIGIGAPNPKVSNAAQARAGAITAAKMTALRDLIATIKGMYISSEQTVEDYMTTSDVVKTKVEGIAKAFRTVGKPVYLSDGSVEVTVEMSIDGDLSALVMDEMSFSSTGEAPTNTSYATIPQSGGIYSGLVVDCSHLSLRPALAPKITDTSGSEVYGSSYVTREFAVQQGMMGYLKDINKAAGNPRVGDNPLVVKAIEVGGANKTDIIISVEDAMKIRELAEKLNFLRECRVISIIK
ncbi:MAG: hypothetical protein JXR48_02285 [Candidatus Delongbacteria bacterium]|nr:hypothetical protein [Candidatus Delongbacteria bacterium]MBN2833775.1 hypothetical protein [Candidatus Delongbacteria bacterium]